MDAYQATMLYQYIFNRDCMVHVHNQWFNCGLPRDVLLPIVEGWWGEGCRDDIPAVGRTPINPSKVELARYGLLRVSWHNMSTQCEYMHAPVVSPSPDRGHVGDIYMDGKYLTAVTGEYWDQDRVDHYAEKITAMLRVMTIISFNHYYGDTSLRHGHDVMPAHWFDRNDVDPFIQNAGASGVDHANNRLDRDDWERALDMFFERMGWDVATGIPTLETLLRLGLPDMANALRERGLLPA
jgi:aldehyde:ferredoxin oxidoreductase